MAGFRSASGSPGFRGSTSSGGFRTAGTGSIPGEPKKKQEGFKIAGHHIPGSKVLEDVAHDFKDITYNIPAGLIYTGAAVKDAATGDFQPLENIATGTVKQMYDDFRHPLRHPGYMILDVLSLTSLGLGTGARFAEASRLAALGEGGQAAKVIVRGFRDTSPRTVQFGEGEPIRIGQWSRSAGSRIVQRKLDRLREQFPDAPILGRSLKARIPFHLEQQAHLIGALESAPAQALAQYGTPFGFKHLSEGIGVPLTDKKLYGGNPELSARLTSHIPGVNKKSMSSLENLAIRLVAEQTPIAERLAYEASQIEKGFGNASVHRKNIQLLHQVRDRGYVVESKTTTGREAKAKIVKVLGGYQVQYPKGKLSKVYKKEATAKTLLTKHHKANPPSSFVLDINPENTKLVKALDLAREVAMHREKAAIATGHLTEEAAHARKLAPLQEIRGDLQEAQQVIQSMEPPAVKGQGRLLGVQDLEPALFNVGDESKLFRVPYTQYERRGALRPVGVVREGRGNAIGAKTAPKSFTKTFEGTLMKTGDFRNDVTKLIAETDLEAQRFITLMHVKEKLVALASPTPNGMADPVAIRLETVKGLAMPQPIKAIVDKATKPGEVLSSDEILALGESYDDFRNDMFLLNAPRNLTRKDGYLWIEKKLVKPFLDPEMLSSVRQSTTGGRALKTADAANNALRLGFLYLKPAYAIPNLLGNAALTLIQQGFMAPLNVYRSFRINNHLSTIEMARLDAAMGEGIARAMATGGKGGYLGQATDVAARAWGSVVDVPFRRSSFLHEANKAGYKTIEDVKRLLSKDGPQDELIDIALNANKEMVDFARLGPAERSILRRVLFFYPWLKGSSVLAGRMLVEHPFVSAIQENLSKQGKQEVDRRLGFELPSYLQGYVPVGGTKQNPELVNPAAFSLFQTPGQVSEMISGELSGDRKPGFSPFSLVNPGTEAGVIGLTGVDPFTGRRSTNSLLDDTVATLTGGMAPNLLYHRLTQDQSKKLFPLTRKQAIEQFTLGVTKKKTSRARLYEASQRETQ